VPVTLLRPFMTYGPGQKAHKLIPYSILSLLKGEPPKISSALRMVDWVYVQDVIAAFVSAAVTPEAVGTVIDLGSGSLVPVREVVNEIHRLIPQSPAPRLGEPPDRMIETVRCADTETAMRILHWKATTALPDGLSETIEWYRERLLSTSNASRSQT
jgi:UDP-glucose 4-epimerase